MLYTGKKIKFFDREAVILTCLDNEVLIFIEKGYTKWVDKTLLELPVEDKELELSLS